MPINHSFSLLFCNFKLVSKLILFIIIILLLVVSLYVGLVAPLIEGYLAEMQAEFPMTPDEVMRHPIISLRMLFDRFVAYISQNTGNMTLNIVYMGLIIIAIRFFLLLPALPLTKIMSGKMTTNFDATLLGTFLAILPQALLYSLVSAIVFGIIDFLLLIALLLLLSVLMPILSLISLPLVLALGVLIFSFRMTILSQWAPEIVKSEEKNIFKALKSALQPTVRNFRKNYICITVVNFIFLAIILTTLIPTIGLFPILFIPCAMLMYATLCLTLNFTFHQQKYYINNGVTVYDPTKKY